MDEDQIKQENESLKTTPPSLDDMYNAYLRANQSVDYDGSVHYQGDDATLDPYIGNDVEDFNEYDAGYVPGSDQNENRVANTDWHRFRSLGRLPLGIVEETLQFASATASIPQVLAGNYDEVNPVAEFFTEMAEGVGEANDNIISLYTRDSGVFDPFDAEWFAKTVEGWGPSFAMMFGGAAVGYLAKGAVAGVTGLAAGATRGLGKGAVKRAIRNNADDVIEAAARKNVDNIVARDAKGTLVHHQNRSVQEGVINHTDEAIEEMVRLEKAALKKERRAKMYDAARKHVRNNPRYKGLDVPAQSAIAALTSRNSENLMESRDTYEYVYERTKRLHPEYSEEQLKKVAGEAAAQNYAYGMSLVAIDFLQFTKLLSAFGGSKAVAGMRSKAKSVLSAAAIDMGSEGGEEGLQYIFSQNARNQGMDIVDPDLFQSAMDATGDKQFWDSVVQGAIGGIVFQSPGYVARMLSKDEDKTDAQKERDKVKAMVENDDLLEAAKNSDDPSDQAAAAAAEAAKKRGKTDEEAIEDAFIEKMNTLEDLHFNALTELEKSFRAAYKGDKDMASGLMSAMLMEAANNLSGLSDYKGDPVRLKILEELASQYQEMWKAGSPEDQQTKVNARKFVSDIVEKGKIQSIPKYSQVMKHTQAYIKAKLENLVKEQEAASQTNNDSNDVNDDYFDPAEAVVDPQFEVSMDDFTSVLNHIGAMGVGMTRDEAIAKHGKPRKFSKAKMDYYKVTGRQLVPDAIEWYKRNNEDAPTETPTNTEEVPDSEVEGTPDDDGGADNAGFADVFGEDEGGDTAPTEDVEDDPISGQPSVEERPFDVLNNEDFKFGRDDLMTTVNYIGENAGKEKGQMSKAPEVASKVMIAYKKVTGRSLSVDAIKWYRENKDDTFDSDPDPLDNTPEETPETPAEQAAEASEGITEEDAASIGLTLDEFKTTFKHHGATLNGVEFADANRFFGKPKKLSAAKMLYKNKLGREMGPDAREWYKKSNNKVPSDPQAATKTDGEKQEEYHTSTATLDELERYAEEAKKNKAPIDIINKELIKRINMGKESKQATKVYNRINGLTKPSRTSLELIEALDPTRRFTKAFIALLEQIGIDVEVIESPISSGLHYDVASNTLLMNRKLLSQEARAEYDKGRDGINPLYKALMNKSGDVPAYENFKSNYLAHKIAAMLLKHIATVRKDLLRNPELVEIFNSLPDQMLKDYGLTSKNPAANMSNFLLLLSNERFATDMNEQVDIDANGNLVSKLKKFIVKLIKAISKVEFTPYSHTIDVFVQNLTTKKSQVGDDANNMTSDEKLMPHMNEPVGDKEIIYAEESKETTNLQIVQLPYEIATVRNATINDKNQLSGDAIVHFPGGEIKMSLKEFKEKYDYVVARANRSTQFATSKETETAFTILLVDKKTGELIINKEFHNKFGIDSDWIMDPRTQFTKDTPIVYEVTKDDASYGLDRKGELDPTRIVIRAKLGDRTIGIVSGATGYNVPESLSEFRDAITNMVKKHDFSKGSFKIGGKLYGVHSGDFILTDTQRPLSEVLPEGLEFELGVINKVPLDDRPGATDTIKINYNSTGEVVEETVSTRSNKKLIRQAGAVVVRFKNKMGKWVWFIANTKKIKSDASYMLKVMQSMIGEIDLKEVHKLVRFSNHDKNGNFVKYSPQMDNNVKHIYGFAKPNDKNLKKDSIILVPDSMATYRSMQTNDKKKKPEAFSRMQDFHNEGKFTNYKVVSIGDKVKLIKLDHNLNETGETATMTRQELMNKGVMHYAYHFSEHNGLFEASMQIDRDNITKDDLDKLETNIMPQHLMTAPRIWTSTQVYPLEDTSTPSDVQAEATEATITKKMSESKRSNPEIKLGPERKSKRFSKILNEKLQKLLHALYPHITVEYVDGEIKPSNKSDVFDQREYQNQVNYRLRAVEKLTNPRARSIWDKGIKNNWPLSKILTELQIPKEQKKMILDIVDRDTFVPQESPKKIIRPTLDDIIIKLLKDNSYVISVNRATEEDHKTPTKIYKRLSVPGGVNYQENEISTPAIKPIMKGHAAFSTDNGIGWFRSDEKQGQIRSSTDKKISYEQWFVNNYGRDMFESYGMDEDSPFRIAYESVAGTETKVVREDPTTRRVLELQSDLFQKARGIETLVDRGYHVGDMVMYKGDVFKIDSMERNREHIMIYAISRPVDGDYQVEFVEQHDMELADDTIRRSESDFLQLLNQRGNWINFFIQSIVQDSYKKGYKKVLFPRGKTAAKIEGHTVLQDQVEILEQTLARLERDLGNVPQRVETEINRRLSLINELKQLVESSNSKIPSKFYVQDMTYYYKNGELLVADNSGIEAVSVDQYMSAAQHSKSLEYEPINLDVDDLREEFTTLHAERIMIGIDSTKEDIKRHKEEGFEKLAPIEAFYENRVTNILTKLYTAFKYTDEHGNEWTEVSLSQPKVADEILLQKDKNDKILGQAHINAAKILIDAVNQKQDTLPHEYAHHYISMFRNTAIVQEGIKRFGSEEALVQAIGEQVVAQKGEALNWWKRFTRFILDLLSDREVLQVLTDSFLTNADLNDYKYNNERLTIDQATEILGEVDDNTVTHTHGIIVNGYLSENPAYYFNGEEFVKISSLGDLSDLPVDAEKNLYSKANKKSKKINLEKEINSKWQELVPSLNAKKEYNNIIEFYNNYVDTAGDVDAYDQIIDITEEMIDAGIIDLPERDIQETREEVAKEMSKEKNDPNDMVIDMTAHDEMFDLGDPDPTDDTHCTKSGD